MEEVPYLRGMENTNTPTDALTLVLNHARQALEIAKAKEAATAAATGEAWNEFTPYVRRCAEWLKRLEAA